MKKVSTLKELFKESGKECCLFFNINNQIGEFCNSPLLEEDKTPSKNPLSFKFISSKILAS
jgi:hypothetical protein